MRRRWAIRLVVLPFALICMAGMGVIFHVLMLFCELAELAEGIWNDA